MKKCFPHQRIGCGYESPTLSYSIKSTANTQGVHKVLHCFHTELYPHNNNTWSNLDHFSCCGLVSQFLLELVPFSKLSIVFIIIYPYSNYIYMYCIPLAIESKFEVNTLNIQFIA